MKAEYFIHETSCIDQPCVIGSGTKVWHFSHIMKNVKIGTGCNIGQNVFIAEGVIVGNNVKIQNNVSLYAGLEIEDDVFLGPSCVLTNVMNPRAQINRQGLYEKTLIRRGSTVGANATIVCGIELGRYCFIAAGSVVIKDVPEYALMVGNPAKQIGWMSRHGVKLKSSNDDEILICPESGYRYELKCGKLSCLDIDEEADLPNDMKTGKDYYKNLKR